MRSRSRPGLRWSQAIWECPDRGPSGLVFLGKSQTWTGTMGFGPVQTGSQSVWDQTSPTLALRRHMIVLGPSTMKGSGYIPPEAGSAHVLRRCMIFLGPSAMKGGGYIPPEAGSAHVLRRRVIFLGPPTVKAHSYLACLGPCAPKAHDIPWPSQCKGGLIYLGPTIYKGLCALVAQWAECWHVPP